MFADGSPAKSAPLDEGERQPPIGAETNEEEMGGEWEPWEDEADPEETDLKASIIETVANPKPEPDLKADITPVSNPEPDVEPPEPDFFADMQPVIEASSSVMSLATDKFAVQVEDVDDGWNDEDEWS